MMDELSLDERIRAGYAGLSRGQRALGDFILKNYERAAFMTAEALASAVGVSESTVVRFACRLGYDGYPRLHRELQELVRSKLTTVQRIEMSAALSDPGDILESVLKADVSNIRRTLDGVDRRAFNAAVDAILSAGHLYVLGLRSSAILSQYLCHYLNFLLPDVVEVTASRDIFEQLLRVTDRDVLIAVSFPRYSSRTAEAARYVARKGGRVIAVTDSRAAPVARQAGYCLTASSNMASFVDSLTAPLSLANALIVAVSARRKPQTEAAFAELESLWSRYAVYTDGAEGKL